MHSNLLQQAFQKAQDTISSDKPTHMSRHLSDFILEDSREQFGEKSLRNYYKCLLKGEEVNLKPYVVQSLCHYLGYKNYDAYVLNVPIKKEEKFKNHKKGKTSHIFTLVFTLFFFTAYIFSFSRKRRSIREQLRDCQNDLENHFYRIERLMSFMQGEAA